MKRDLGTAIELIAERTYHNTKNIKQEGRQRRDEFVDLFGVEYMRNGSSGNPAKFYVSISGDEAYMERFQFKLIISPFQVNADLALTSTDLDITGSSIGNLRITPNPHNHQMVAGLTNIPVTTGNFTIKCEGIDVTPYLRAQVTEGGWRWFDGEGVYPSTDLEQSFDMMEVACDLKAEGREADANTILRQGLKPIEIASDQPFTVTMILYLKYQHMNR